MQGQITQESPWTNVPVTQTFNSTATIATFIQFFSKQPHSFNSSARNRDPLGDTRLLIITLLLRQLRILSQAYNSGIYSILTTTAMLYSIRLSDS